MIARYTRPEMGRIWTDENRFQRWLDVEIAVCETLARRGVIPKRALAVIQRKARFDVRGILRIEEKVKHDVIAFLTNVARYVGPDSRFIHMGLTSSDVLDTALALQLGEAGALIDQGLKDLMKVLARQARAHRRTVMIGRTHGIHAEPITLGLVFALWHAEFARHRERLAAASESVRVGKLSGAVGTFAHLDPGVEAEVCRRLGLRPDPISTQVIQRDRHAHFLTTLALIAASIEKAAVEIRHLQRTDVREAEEFFSAGQKGSSSMPHKRNPITSEQLSGLSRVVRANAQAGLENVALWHERDISHSSVERVIVPDSTILIDYMLAKLTRLLDRLLVYPDRMRRNMNLTRGLIYSQALLLALVDAGATREEAYHLVQRNAMQVWAGTQDFQELVSADADIGKRLTRRQIGACFDPARHLRHVDTLLRRALGRAKGTR